MTLLINIAQNSTHFQFWVGKQDNSGGLVTLWKYALKACWCLEQPGRDLPGLCTNLPRITHALREKFPYTANRCAQLSHFLLSSDKQTLFCAAAPLFLMAFWTIIEDHHLLHNTEVRTERLFFETWLRLAKIYFGAVALNILFSFRSASLTSVLDHYVERSLVHTAFVLYVLFVVWAADAMFHQDTLLGNLVWVTRGPRRWVGDATMGLLVLGWH